jgi:hypothetical protein
MPLRPVATTIFSQFFINWIEKMSEITFVASPAVGEKPTQLNLFMALLKCLFGI